MSEPFLAEVRMVGFNFAPRNWAFCDGQILPINQNQSLYSLLGTIYGGDGRTSFGLPDLRGRTPIHRSDSNPLGQKGGSEAVSLSTVEIPSHTHQVKAISTPAAGSDRTPANDFPASGQGLGIELYSTEQNAVFADNAIGASGGGQAHNNMQPYQTVAYCIALQGLFPSRN